MMLSEEYTAGVLAGIPLFCINRKFSLSSTLNMDGLGAHYNFEFANGYGASIIEFSDHLKSFHKYELAVLETGIVTFKTSIGNPCQGNTMCMHELLTRIEKFDTHPRCVKKCR